MDLSSWCDDFILKVQDAHSQLNQVEGASLDSHWAGLILQATHQLLAAVLEIATATQYELKHVMVKRTLSPAEEDLPLDELIQTFLSLESEPATVYENLNAVELPSTTGAENDLPMADLQQAQAGVAQEGDESLQDTELKDDQALDEELLITGAKDWTNSMKMAKKRRRKMPRTGIKRIVSSAPATIQASRLRQRAARSKSRPIVTDITDEEEEEDGGDNADFEEDDDVDKTFYPKSFARKGQGRKKQYKDKAANNDDGLLAHRLKFATYNCFLCTPEVPFDDRDALSKHLLENHVSTPENGKRGLICPICKASKPLKKLRNFWSEEEEVQCALVKILQHLYLTHAQKVPPYISIWQCPHCDYFTVRKYNHRTHLQSHAEPLPCTLCGTLIKPSCMKVHLLTCRINIQGKPPGEGFPCPECNKVFSLKNGLSVHINRIHKRTKSLPCYVCAKVFYSQKEFHAHLFNKHNLNLENKEVFKCDQCSFQDLSATEVKKHKQKVHNSNHHLCDTCGKVFNHPTYLSKHKRIHEDKEMRCPQCPYVTNRKEAMENHVAAQHKNQRVSCPAGCGYSTGYSGNMTKHLKKCSQHKATKQQEAAPEPGKTFFCPSGCGYQANQPGNLARHTHHCKAFQGLVETGRIDPTSKACIPVVQEGIEEASTVRHKKKKPVKAQQQFETEIRSEAMSSMEPGFGMHTNKGTIIDESRGVTLQPLLPPSINPPPLLQQMNMNQEANSSVVMGGNHGDQVTGQVYQNTEHSALTNKFLYPYF